MQGVDQFGDFVIRTRLKMMIRPGEQLVIYRRTAGHSQQDDAAADASAARAQKGMEMVRPAAS